MRILTLAAFGTATLLTIAAVLVVAGARVGAQDVDWNARAKQTWSETCQACHTVPDVAFATDRAFLRQVIETS